jgi:hypothetical protein
MPCVCRACGHLCVCVWPRQLRRLRESKAELDEDLQAASTARVGKGAALKEIQDRLAVDSSQKVCAHPAARVAVPVQPRGTARVPQCPAPLFIHCSLR